MPPSPPPPFLPSPDPAPPPTSVVPDDDDSTDATGIIIFATAGGGAIVLPVVLIALLYLNEKRRGMSKVGIAAVGVHVEPVVTEEEEENSQRRAQRRAARRARAGASDGKVQPVPPTAEAQLQQPPLEASHSASPAMWESELVDDHMWSDESLPPDEPRRPDHRPPPPAPMPAPPPQCGPPLEPVRSACSLQPFGSRPPLTHTVSQPARLAPFRGQGNQLGTQFAISDAQTAGLTAQYRVQSNPTD